MLWSLLRASDEQRTRRLAECTSARHKTPQCAHMARSGASWGCLVTPLLTPLLPVVSPGTHYMFDRCPTPRSTCAPRFDAISRALPSSTELAEGGGRFRFLPLFVTYLELNRHGISRKRENAESIR